MKQFKLVFVAAILVISYASNAQLVGLNAFLKGDHVEVGVNKCGVYGTTVNPPAGYHPNWVAGLGFVADSDLDGWDVGSPYNYCGDYFVPGTPEEGWQVQIGGSVYTNASNGCSPSEIPGGIDSYDYTGGLYTVTWEGSIPSEDVTITQVTTLQVDKT